MPSKSAIANPAINWQSMEKSKLAEAGDRCLGSHATMTLSVTRSTNSVIVAGPRQLTLVTCTLQADRLTDGRTHRLQHHHRHHHDHLWLFLFLLLFFFFFCRAALVGYFCIIDGVK